MPIRRRHPSPRGSSRFSHARRRRTARWCSAYATMYARMASPSAVIALSGGIDSALTAVIAVDALGADAVTGVSMPSRYSSEGSRDDAKTLADNLGIRYLTLPIEPIFADMLESLARAVWAISLVVDAA